MVQYKWWKDTLGDDDFWEGKMNNVYTANISSVQDFYQCRFRWVCKWLMNRVPRNEGPALTQGKLLHTIFEDHLTGKMTMPDSVSVHLVNSRAMRDALDMDDPTRLGMDKAITGIEDLAEALFQWSDRYVWEVPVLEVEQPFEIAHPLDPHFHIKGRPDRRGVMQGMQWHVQNRGLAASMNFGIYMELATRHYHEHVYAVAGAEKYPMYPVGGTLMNLVRKLKFRTNVGKKNEAVKTLDQMFFQHPMVIDLNGDLHKHVMCSLLEHLKEMERVEMEWRRDGSMPPPNEKMNGGFVGNSIDPYFRVLTGTASLFDSNLFKEREDTYATAEVEVTE